MKDHLSLDVLVKLPELMNLKIQDKVTPLEKQKLLGLVDKSLKLCDAERIREAKALGEDVKKNLVKLQNFVEQCEKLREQVNSELGKKFEERLKSLGLGGEVDPVRIAQEVMIQIDRSDINEELSRLSEHIHAYFKLIQDSKSFGKKMDFYAQELLREVNTIGSKSQVAKMTALVVDAKSVVERIREQVQNIE